MNRTMLIISLVIAATVGGCIYYRSTQNRTVSEKQEKEKTGGHADGKDEGDKGKKDGDNDHGGKETVKMTAKVQQQSGVVVAAAQKKRMAGAITVTGKVEANADKIAHLSPRISGKIVSVRGSLGDTVVVGQALATLDSVELGEALNRYRQSKTKLTLAQSNMERIKALVEKKIAARKDILQAETEYKSTQTELHTDEERLSLYGVPLSDFQGEDQKRPLLHVKAPMGGTITEKHAIVGELADPSKSLYTIADLSSIWVVVDVNEKDLGKIYRGQAATLSVGAFPEMKMKGRITYIADLVDPGTRTVKARIEVANPGRKLKPEMFATVELMLATDAPPSLAVPEDALQDLDGLKVLFVTENGVEFAARPVQSGRAAGGMVEIVSGLKEGEKYAVQGSFILKSELKKSEMSDGQSH